MSEAKFTKGEWVVYDCNSDWVRVGVDEIVIGMDSYNDDPSDHYCAHKITIDDADVEARANAHLIAAAPEMYEEIERDLESLYRFVKTLAQYSNDWLFYTNEIKRKEYLLAKARGES